MEYPFKDLLPLDEVLEREGYYKDWTHLDPEVFYSLTQISEYIKTKGFGIDVRLLISQLAEHFGLSVVEITDIANNLIARQSAVENRQDAVEVFNRQAIQEMTDKDVISAPEIIEARLGEAKLADKMREMVAGILDDAISPDDYTGTDAQKVQQAINQSIIQNRGVKFSRIYDITGSTLIIDKENGDGSIWSGARDRRPIHFLGVGGGLRKDDSGFIFTSNFEHVGDLYFNGMKFYGVAGEGGIVFDAEKLIRVQSFQTNYRNIDKVVLATSKYIQSYHFVGGSVIGGKGNAFETPGAYDFVIGGGFYCEHRENFFHQSPVMAGSTWNKMYSCRFTDIMVEGLTGDAFYFRNTEGLKMDGVYLESNKGRDIVFDENGYFEGVNLSNIRNFESETSEKTTIIHWGGRLYNVQTSNMLGKNIAVHDTTKVITGKVISIGDRGSDSTRKTIPDVDPTNKIYRLDFEFETETDTANGTRIFKTNELTRMTQSKSVTVPANSRMEIKFTFRDEIHRDDIVSTDMQVTSASTNIVKIENNFRDAADKKRYNVVVKNDMSSDVVINMQLNILKLRGSMTG